MDVVIFIESSLLSHYTAKEHIKKQATAAGVPVEGSKSGSAVGGAGRPLLGGCGEHRDVS